MGKENEQENVSITPPLKRWTQRMRIFVCLLSLNLMVVGVSLVYRSVTGFRLAAQYSPMESEEKIKSLKAKLAELEKESLRYSGFGKLRTSSGSELVNGTPGNDGKMSKENSRIRGKLVLVQHDLWQEESFGKETKEARDSMSLHVIFGVLGAIVTAGGLMGVWLGIFRPDRIPWVLVPTKQAAADGDETR